MGRRAGILDFKAIKAKEEVLKEEGKFVNIWERSVPARSKGKCKGPGARVCLEARRPL